MALVINNNSMAADVAGNLNAHYSRLQTSTQRLSSGLRINSAADDAAGLAIRELQRADIAALHQGTRNANDAISLLATADGALGVIDEKLIRMKELAEQAATGTYDSTQRIMIDSEFHAMADEIDRIARATEFNGIHLLDGSLSGAHDGSGLNATGELKIHFGTANDSAEDYYYINIGRCTTRGLGLKYAPPKNLPKWAEEAEIDWESGTILYEVDARIAGARTSPYGVKTMNGIDYYELPVGLVDIQVVSANADNFFHKPHVNLFSKSGAQLTGVDPDNNHAPDMAKGYMAGGASNWWNGADESGVINGLKRAGLVNGNAVYSNMINNSTGAVITYGDTTIKIDKGLSENDGAEILTIDKITADLVFLIGGHENGVCNNYKLKISARLGDDFLDEYGPEGGPIIAISTQELAQEALVRVNNAIVSKDKIRAHLGALQNRLENTVSNLTIQAENLQAAESRISDVDVATEMTQFVRNQILSQSAIAMLSQANSMPQMAMQLIG